MIGSLKGSTHEICSRPRRCWKGYRKPSVASTRRAVNGNPGILDCASHFERILYDNSQLARVYLHAWQVTGNEFFRTITEEILDYVVR
jgi:hypothetical protein